MRILVTADVHLSAGHPERQDALADVLRIANEEGVEYLLIAGDLFDAGIDVEEVKPDIRELFSDNDFQTYVIPGNHDADAFRDEDHFGNDIDVLSEEPFARVDLGAVNLLAVPFVEESLGAFTDELHAARDDERLDVLLLHGTLSTTTGEAFGEESRYFPFTPEELLETGVQYVFAGHIHSSPTKRTFGDDDCVLAYPGSPVSITTKETNKRGVWLFDVDEPALRKRDVESFHYVREELDLSPGEAPAKLERLEARLADRDLENAMVLLEPAGFIEMDEGEFFQELSDVAERAGAVEYEIERGRIESAKAILDSSLYREFERTLEEAPDVDDPRAVRHTVLKALSAEERG